MKEFLNARFLLSNPTAEKLYHDYAAEMPIIDYHNHLSPEDIANNKNFENLTMAWLSGDHYKWRAMRANGVNEDYITGHASDDSKFQKWAYTVPYTARNPLYHWTHLELQRYFDISNLLNEHSSSDIYARCNTMLQTPELSTQGILSKFNVKVICTTDDPADDLDHHASFRSDNCQLIPGFRPDRVFALSSQSYLEYLSGLSSKTNRTITSLQDLVLAVQDRIDHFHDHGCRLSDHGLNQLYDVEFSDDEADRILKKRLSNKKIFEGEAMVFQTAMLYYLARMYHAKNWTMQFHLGALRNNNDRLSQQLGSDVGCDSIGDFTQARGLSTFLNRLDREQKLPKTILYNVNPSDNAVFATMAGNFNDGSSPGKIQWGAAWWFLDQKDGIQDHLDMLSQMGLISRFVGMLTDSRSFLSFPRHEYFRRILCDAIGSDVENGLLPNDLNWMGGMIQDICYNNAKDYFGFN